MKWEYLHNNTSEPQNSREYYDKLGSMINSPVLHSARHQRPARERHKIRTASRKTVDNQAPRNTNFTH